MQAVLSASADRRVAEQFAGQLDAPRCAAGPDCCGNAASLIRALQEIGQGEAARAIAHEMVVAHLMQRLAVMIPDGTQS